MAKKNEPIITWESKWQWDWQWFAIGALCDVKGKFYMVHLGFLHYQKCLVKMYPVKKGIKK